MMGQTENVMSGAAAPQVQAAAAAVGRPAESAAVLEVQAQHPARRPPSPSLRQSPPQAKRSKPSVDVPVGVPVVQVLGDAPECVPCGGDEAEEADVVWQACDQPDCAYKSKHARDLKRHKAFKHNIGVVWHACDQCEVKSKHAGDLKRHKAFKHGIGVTWHACDQCEVKTKHAGALKVHKAFKHGIGVTWHACDQCEVKTKHAGALKVHKAFKHGIGVTWHACDQCEVKSKHASHLKRHKASRHGIGVVWHACDQLKCEVKTKRAEDLKQHKADVHDIGVVWHECDAAPGKCEYKAKQSSRLHDHVKRCHARVYAQRKCEQEERVRRALLDAGWQEWHLSETMPPVGYFRREKRIDFKCAELDTEGKNARIDFVLGVPNGYVFLEVDEHQHQYGYDASISCDMKRMSHVTESLFVETGGNPPWIYWLRYNPHAWRVGGALQSVPKAEREARLVAWLEGFECVAPLGIGYAFYDCEAEEDGGALAVLDNGEYHPCYAEVVDNLLDLR